MVYPTADGQTVIIGWPNKNRTFFEIPYFCSHYSGFCWSV